jgi:hypothetical protein
MPKHERIIIKISLVVLFTVFLSSNSIANEQDSQYDSIYRYNALENRVNFINSADGLDKKLPKDIILIDSNIKRLEDVTKQQINSIEKSEDTMTTIKEMSTLKIFVVGNRLGVLKFQMIQMKAQSQILETIILETADILIKNKINIQLEALEKEQKRVESFIFEQENKFSLFGWLVASL